MGKAVLDAAFRVHRALEPGLLESLYQIAMQHVIETEVKLPILFEGVRLESGLRLDMLVDHSVMNVPRLKDGIKRIVV